MKVSPLIFSGPMVRANRAGIKRMTRRVVDIDRLKVVMRKDVRPDYPLNFLADNRNTLAPGGNKLKGVFNDAGAVSCHTPNGGILGLKPGEFDFVCPYAQGETVLTTEGRKQTWTIIPHESRVWVRETWRIGAWRDFGRKVAVDYQASRELVQTPWLYLDEVTYRKVRSDVLRELEKQGIQADEEGHFSWEYGQAPISWRPSIHMPRWACRDMYTVTKVRVERLLDISNQDAIAEGIYQTRKNGWLWFDPAETETPHCSHALSPKQAFMWLWDSINAKRPGRSWIANPWVWVIEYDNPLWKGKSKS